MRTRLAGIRRLAVENPRWRRYFLARWISVTGTTVAPLAVAFAVLDLGGGATAIGLVLVTGPIVFMAVSPVAGVIADRYPRHLVLTACQTLSGLVQGAAATLVLTGSATVPALAGLMLLLGAAGAVMKPAAQGLLPQLVDKDQLADANSLVQICNNTVAIGGPALAGVVIAYFGAGPVLAWDSITFFLSAGIILTVPVQSRSRGAAAGFATEIVEGWRAFLSYRWVAALAMLSAVSSGLWAVAVTVLGPVYAVQHLGGAVAWGTFNASVGCGLALGTVTAFLVRPRRAGLVCCLAMLSDVALLSSMAAHLPFPVIAVAAAGCGAAGTVQLVTYTSTLQTKLPDDQIGRITAMIGLVGTIFVPLGIATAGLLADTFGMGTVDAAGAVIALLAAVGAYSIPDVRRLQVGHQPTRTQ